MIPDMGGKDDGDENRLHRNPALDAPADDLHRIEKIPCDAGAIEDRGHQHEHRDGYEYEG